MTRKPDPAFRTVTIRNVPGEYAKLFNDIARFGLAPKFEHVPSIPDGSPQAELRVAQFCEMVHRYHDQVFGQGSGDCEIQQYKSLQAIRERADAGPEQDAQ